MEDSEPQSALTGSTLREAHALRRNRVFRFSVFLCVAAGLLCGCTGGQATAPYSVAVGGSPRPGRQVIAQYKCGSCHTIPGIPHAHGVFGPPLNFVGRRTILAGNFPNTPDDLVRWVMSPQSMKPGTAMPDLGLDEQQARDVAAYLETLR
jgi:cytochrome c1